MQRSGSVIIAKIIQDDGASMTLSYRALMKLLAAGQFVSEARRTLLCEAERQRLSLEGHTPRQPVKRRLTYEDAYEGDTSENEGSPIPPSGTVPFHMLEPEPLVISSDDEELGEMEL